MNKQIIYVDLIHSKIAYILALLASYSSLDLTKRINDINDDIDKIKKSFLEEKNHVDVRDVIKLRNNLKELKSRLNDDIIVSLKGHKIACLLFEVYSLIKLFVCEYPDIIKEYLLLASEYLYTSGRIVNNETLCYEIKFN